MELFYLEKLWTEFFVDLAMLCSTMIFETPLLTDSWKYQRQFIQILKFCIRVFKL